MSPATVFRCRRRALVPLALVAIGIASSLAAADEKGETWAEKLGFPAGKRVLILHADDVGMCAEANQAAERYLAAGHVQSAALMVPCPWFNEFAAWYRRRPQHDVGIHLTLTSEWKFYRWGPVAPRSEVRGLIDRDGYLHRDVLSVATNATAAEVEKEIRAQVDRALARGIRPGHLDTHMGTLYARPDFVRAYIKVAVEYDIPAMVVELTPRAVARFRKQGYPISDEMVRDGKEYPLPKLDDFRTVPGGATYEEKLANFFALVKSLRPGITELIFHPAFETEGLRRITGSWQQRSWEAKMFSDPRVREFFAREGVLFTNWKEMMERHRARQPKKTARADRRDGRRKPSKTARAAAHARGVGADRFAAAQLRLSGRFASAERQPTGRQGAAGPAVTAS